MKQKIDIKIQQDSKYFYIRYNRSPEWERIKASDLPKTVRAMLCTFCSGEYEAVIDAEEYTGI